MTPFIYIAAMLVGQTPTNAVRTDCMVRGQATLIASSAELRQENLIADKCRISEIKDKANLKWYIEQGFLVPLRDADDEDYEVSPDLAEGDPDDPELYLYARPWTKDFIETLAARAHTELGIRIMITSLVRPEEYQQRLRDYNSYAARESTHPTGATVDISLSDLTWRQRNWIRKYMLDLERDGLVEATEERGNYCMHVFVHPSFTPSVKNTVPAEDDDLLVPPPSK